MLTHRQLQAKDHSAAVKQLYHTGELVISFHSTLRYFKVFNTPVTYHILACVVAAWLMHNLDTLLIGFLNRLILLLNINAKDCEYTFLDLCYSFTHY